jgi:hypothetical protein
LLFASATLLRTLLAVEHIGAGDFVFAASHQSQLNLILNVLDVDSSRGIGAPAQSLNDVVRQRLNRFMNTTGRGGTRAFNSHERFRDGD